MYTLQPLVVMKKTHQSFYPPKRKDKGSSASTLPGLTLVTVSYLDKPLSAPFHASERSINAIISGIQGALRDMQAHGILEACKLN